MLGMHLYNNDNKAYACQLVTSWVHAEQVLLSRLVCSEHLYQFYRCATVRNQAMQHHMQA